MDDVKDKLKDFMKKVNKPFASSSSSSSSGKFKGQGRVLGSASSDPSSHSPVANRTLTRPAPVAGASAVNPPRSTNPKPSSPSKSGFKIGDGDGVEAVSKGGLGEFSGFEPIFSSGKRMANGASLNVFECPVCGGAYRSEEEVMEHVDGCLNDQVSDLRVESGDTVVNSNLELRSEIAARIGVFMSGEPSEASVEVVLKLLKNIGKEPENGKFRRIRMGNPKIKEALGTAGGVEVLEGVGFRLQEEGGELWAAMEVPSEEQMVALKEAIALLEQRKSHDLSTNPENGDAPAGKSKQVIDRQMRVFFSVPENLAAKIDLPDSFYNLSSEELKREAELRRKKIADSQLLIPKSYKEKQAKAGRRKYKAALIRIQFPDGVVLQAVFKPWEPTTVLYELVSSSLKEPALEFELLQPAAPRRRVVPRFPQAGERPPTLEEEDLVPSALLKFRPMETDSTVFTGLRNELLEISEPLTSAAGVTVL